MTDCDTCIHKAVCDLWQKQESQNAECFFPDSCGLYETCKPLDANERAELQFYRSTKLTPWQVRAMQDAFQDQKKILVGYENDRVNADIKCTDTIAYLNDELFQKLDYADYSELFDQISSITDWENEIYGGSNKQYMKKGGSVDGVET